jgi:hypothetical protein
MLPPPHVSLSLSPWHCAQEWYSCVFPQFVDVWRTEFGNPKAFFGIELLPP